MLTNQASVPTGHAQTIPAASSPSPPPRSMRLNPEPSRNGGSPRSAETASTASKRSRQIIELDTEDDEEEKEIPFVRERKQAAVSTSHGGERENTTDDES
ncbi:hypothetical protein P8452_08833 [Trifolium repens]|nr:hypothetical protein P8452_08833 [Trifolium repens]